MKYYVYKGALTSRQLRRYQKDPIKWVCIWIDRDMQYYKELENEF